MGLRHYIEQVQGVGAQALHRASAGRGWKRGAHLGLWSCWRRPVTVGRRGSCRSVAAYDTTVVRRRRAGRVGAPGLAAGRQLRCAALLPGGRSAASRGRRNGRGFRDWGRREKTGREVKNCLRKRAATEITPNRNSRSGQTGPHTTGISLVVACAFPCPLRVLPCPESVRAPLTGRVRRIPARCHSVHAGRVCFMRPLPLLAIACGYQGPLRLCVPL